MESHHEAVSPVIDVQPFFDGLDLAPGAGVGDLAGARRSARGSTRTATCAPLRVLESEQLRRIGKGSDLGLFTLLVTGVYIALYRYTGVQDLQIATLGPDSRDRRRLLLRASVAGCLRVGELIEKSRRVVEHAFSDSAGDLAEIVERLRSRSTVVAREAVSVACVFNRIHGLVQKPEWCDLVIGLTADGPTLALRAEYDPAAPGAALVLRFLENLTHVLEVLPESLDQQIEDVEIVCEKERQELLAFNKTATDYPAGRSVPDLFEEQAALHGDDIAIVSTDLQLTYRELSERANALARLLRSQGVRAGDRVAVLADLSVDAVVAILAIVNAGGCYVPISPTDPEARIRARLKHSGSHTVMTSRRYANTILRRLHEARVLLVDGPGLTRDSVNAAPSVAPDTPLCVMYTSGTTTGQPRGVIINHRGVVRLVKGTSYVQFRRGDRIVGWSRLDFDGATFEIWAALLNGLTILVCPREEVLDPHRLQRFIERHGATMLWLTAPLFAELVQGVPDVLAGLRTLFVGGDVVSPSHVALVRRHHPQLQVINGYGPTENTTYSTTHTVDRDYVDRVPIGRPISNSTVYLVNQARRLQPVGAVGELLVGGDGVAAGYLDDPLRTAERFFPFSGETCVYRTGDLARWSLDGLLDFIGRSDEQVKVRGYRIEPGEIAARLLSHPSVRGAAVVPVDDPDGGRTLCAYVICNPTAIADVKTYLADWLPDYMIPQHLIAVDRLPLNANGKVDRRQLPPPSVQRSTARQPPRDEIERKMAAIWREVLGIDDIGADDDFFELGGHSMKAIRLISLIQRDFNVKLGLQEILRSTTIAGLAALVRSATPSMYPTVESQPARASYELSVSQTRLVELYERDPSNAAFNIAHRFTCDGVLDAAAARRAVATLTARHDSLRTRLQRSGERHEQVVEHDVVIPIDVVDLSALPRSEQDSRRDVITGEQERVPFRLEDAPLSRIALLGYGARGFDVLWTMHHIVSDGWSMDVLQSEFTQLYPAYRDGVHVDLEPLRLQYRDYVHWQNRLLSDEASVRGAKGFWRDLLRPPIKMLALPYDFPKTAGGVGRRSAGYHAVIDEETTHRLRTLAKARKTSLFLVLFAGFNRLLAEASGQRDVITGIPSANRDHHDLENVVGFLVDSVVIRTAVDPDEPLAALIDRVAYTTLGILDHAYYPIELACQAADTTWPEILSTFFNMATFGDVNRRLLTDTRWYPIDRVQNAKLELVMYLSEYKNGVEMNVHYYAELFEPATIERLTRRYAGIMDAVSRLDCEVTP